MGLYKLDNSLRWGLIGAVLGGTIAIIGYLIMQPSTDSLILFVLLRAVIGAIVAMFLGPILVNKSKNV